MAVVHSRGPNDPRQVRRWQMWRSVQMTTQDAHEKRHGSRAAPAASPARGCWAAWTRIYEWAFIVKK